MNGFSISFSRREWVIQSALLVAESALVWLLANVLIIPFSKSDHELRPAIALTLVFAATLVPRVLHDIGVWGKAYSVCTTLSIAGVTALAVKVTAFPEFAIRDRDWLSEAERSLIARPSAADVSVWLIILLSAVVWWRSRYREAPGVSAALLLLRAGTILAIAGAAGQATVRQESADRRASVAILVFFAATLMAVGIARQGDSVHAAEGRWLGSIFLPVSAISALAITVVGILSRNLLSSFGYYLGPLFWLLGLVFDIAFILVSLVVIILLIPIAWILSKFHLNSELITFGDRPPAAAQARGAPDAWGLPDPIRYVVAIFLLAMIFYGLTKFVLKWSSHYSQSRSESTTLMSAGEILSSLFGWIHLPRSAGRTREIDPLAHLRGDPQWAHTVSVRETYAAFLRWMHELQMPRTASATPREYERAMRPFFSGEEELSALEQLSSVYTEVRYGVQPATPEYALEVSNALAALRRSSIARAAKP